MLPQEIIRAKRDGLPLGEDDLRGFVAGMVDGSIGEAQVAALGMAIYFQGMTGAECAALTMAMARSGTMLDWDLDGPVLDKHSSGGVGDLVSLALGPMVAACGAYVPMISGRGLGHTGGTLDKLESIPGYRTMPGRDEFRRAVRLAGVAIIGQTDDLAPADRMFYAVRDVTATVESIPLITASILSKKLAAGLDGLVMDIKTGSGAFMATCHQARELAESIVSVAAGAGLPTAALITCMDEPLAPCAGNALEVRETVRYLTGAERDPRLHEVILALGARLLILGGLAHDEGAARSMLEGALESGAAVERFSRMVAELGGPRNFVEHPDRHLPVARSTWPVLAEGDGYVAAWDTRVLGMAVVALGGGRTRVGQAVDHAVGLTSIARVGTAVRAGEVLAVLHCASAEEGGGASGRAARSAVLKAVRLEPEPSAPGPLIHESHESVMPG
ncbi:thymidine phosphorylase [Pseudodesulfovibrio pelocollis]|uniref:thymidine phosphorylase n=1 Tax=Pseudodesulfovibrio pelocollis TaxID=3051432 RepID=UPI00255AF2E5|nr:thymidine phosphorylase [Pseudodesulfovibrio sp. SB368]